MTTSPLEGPLAAAIGAGMSWLFLDATLERTTETPPADPWDQGGKTTTTYPCRAIHEEYSVGWITAGTVRAEDRRILILATTLSVEPIPGDKVTIRGQTFTIVPPGTGGREAIITDPAKAVWDVRTSR